MKKILFLAILISNLIFAQETTVELPKHLDYKYWNFDMKHELNFKNITASNNLFWKSKIDPILKNRKKQLWIHLSKTVKTIKEDVYTNDENPKKQITTLYKYNNKGDILEKMEHYNKHDEKDYNKTLISYNTFGNITSYIKYTSNSFTDNKEKLEDKYLFFYDKNQNLIMEEQKGATTKIFYYNSINKIEKIEYFGFDPNRPGIIVMAGEPSEEDFKKHIDELRNNLLLRYTFEYNKLGHVILEKKEEIIDSPYKIHTFTHTYRYNKNGTLSYFSTKDFSINYEYNKNKQLLSETLTNLKSNKIKRATRTYNKKGILTEYKSPRDYGKHIYKTTYSYENNNIVKEVVYKEPQPYMGDGEDISTSIYEYNNDNYIIKCIFKGDYEAIETYTYDTSKRLLSYKRENLIEAKVYQNFNYQYDENGGIIKEIMNDIISRTIVYY